MSPKKGKTVAPRKTVAKAVPANVAEPFSFSSVKAVKGGQITTVRRPGRERTPGALEAQYVESRGSAERYVKFNGELITLNIPDEHKDQAVKELLKSADYFGDGRPDLDATQPDKIVFRACNKRAVGVGASSRR